MKKFVKRMDDPPKHPLAEDVYSIDATNWLEVGETLVAGATAAVAPTGLTLEGTPTVETPYVRQLVSGGTDGVEYRITFVMPTSEGRELVAQLLIPVVEDPQQPS